MIKIDPSKIADELKLEIEHVKVRLESALIDEYEAARCTREASDAMCAQSSLATFRKEYRDESGRCEKAQKQVNTLEALVKGLESELADMREKEAIARKARVGQIIADRLEGRSSLPASKFDREIEDLEASLAESRERRDAALRDLEQRRAAAEGARKNALKARADLAEGAIICLAQEIRRHMAEQYLAYRMMGERGQPRHIKVAMRDESLDFAMSSLRGELADLGAEARLAALGAT